MPERQFRVIFKDESGALHERDFPGTSLGDAALAAFSWRDSFCCEDQILSITELKESP